ncbi:hypothetical protein KC336_g8843 [Hortaea werneckii]|nr:hypothetical protein KC336_g8843 [Hortaea werneckii]
MEKLKPQDNHEIMQGRQRLERMRTRQGKTGQDRAARWKVVESEGGFATAPGQSGGACAGTADSGLGQGCPCMTERDLDSKRPSDDIPDLTP